MVGLARYATDVFPPFVAGGLLLANRPRSTRRTVFAALVIAQACLAVVFITVGWVI